MQPSRIILILIFAVLLATAVLLVALFIRRRFRMLQARRREQAEAAMLARLYRRQPIDRKACRRDLLDAYVKAMNEVTLDQETRRLVSEDFLTSRLYRRLLGNLRALSSLKRKQAIHYLGCFDSAEIRSALVSALRVERSEHVKIYLLNALKNKIDQHILQAIVDSIIGSRRYYQVRLIGILKRHLLSVEAHLERIFRRPEMEIKEVFVDLTNVYYRKEFKQILVEELRTIEAFLGGATHPTFSEVRKQRVVRLYYQVLRALANIYDTPLNKPEYLSSSNPEIVKIATDSFQNIATLASVKTILGYADGTELDEHRAHVITRILDSNQGLYGDILDLIQTTSQPDQKALLAHVISHRIDYLLLKLLNRNDRLLGQMLFLIVEKGYTADLIEFLNHNRVPDITKPLIGFLGPLAESIPSFRDELATFADEGVLKGLGIKKTMPEKGAKTAPVPEIRKTRWLLRLLLVTLIICPLVFVLANIATLATNSPRENFTQYIIIVNKIFIVYYLSVNLVYFFVAILSYLRSRRQRRLYALKTKNFLFEPMMLPSISIIAPAYNEELSIVESVNSLLNRDYPEFEVIVVNDGSKDQTVNKLIEHFQLERKNANYSEAIKTKSVRAVYKNRYLPSLTVIDKENGGKADALNVGINFSACEYICGIDADSILEKDALLRLMSSMLDHDNITLALGGSIVPVNGYVVDKGKIESKGLSRSLLAQLQTIEYLRAFNISRGGFAGLRSLLIVSGAFGLFEKRILTEVGGYLTESSLKKGTVGEDMELVVRITRRALEAKLRFRVDYIGNARCYTEVPEARKSFFKQRNRWQRGLVDILSYHRKLIFNPAYRQPGLIGMPYFFIFEMIGPLFEIQAYVAVIVGLALGILSIDIVLLLLLVTVVMGIFMSILSLFISEEETASFSVRDVFNLIVIAVCENFGWRQFVSLYRIKGYLSSLRETNVWGEMNRVGFAQKPAEDKS